MAPRDRIRIAAAQYPLDGLTTLDAFIAKLSTWVASGAATGAEVLVFPEYGAMELAAMRGPEAAASLPASLAAVSDSLAAIDAHHVGLARRHGVHILASSGPSRRPDGRFVNAARLFAPSGAHLVLEKQLMTPFERDWGISAGAPLVVADTVLGRIGVAICYDCEFPLLVRPLAEAGAEVVLIPSCTERISGASRVRTGALARALESTIATVVSPTVGLAPWSPAVDVNTGSAGIYVPAEAGLSETGVVVEGRRDEPGWVTGDVDLAALRRLRAGGEMRNRIDWDSQPGAAATRTTAKVVRLA